MLDSGAEGPGFKSQSRRCRVTVLGRLFTPIVPLYQAAKLVAVVLKVAGVTAGLVESNGKYCRVYDSRHLPRTGISSGTLCSVIEYGLPLPLVFACSALTLLVDRREEHLACKN